MKEKIAKCKTNHKQILICVIDLERVKYEFNVSMFNPNGDLFIHHYSSSIYHSFVSCENVWKYMVFG